MKKNIKFLLISLCFLTGLFSVQAAGELSPVQPGRGYLADGTNDYVIMDNNDGSLNNHTVKFRMQINDTGFTSRGIWGATDADGSRYDFYITSTTEARIFYKKSSGGSYHRNYTGTGITFTVGEVYDVEIQYQDSDVLPRLWINGVEMVGSGSSTVSASATLSKYYLFTIGAGVGTSTYAGEQMVSDVRVYNPDDELIHSWHCDEGDGTVMYDSIENWESNTLVSNGNFVADADWTKGDGWSIQNGIASNDGTGNSTSGMLSQSSEGVVLGKRIRIEFDVIENSNYMKLYVGGLSAGQSVSGNIFGVGHKSYEFVVAGSDSKVYFVNYLSVLQIDNISVKEIREPAHGTITNSTPATFHTTDTDFKSYQNEYGYSEGVPNGIELLPNPNFTEGTGGLDNWINIDCNSSVGTFYGRENVVEIENTNTSTIYLYDGSIVDAGKTYKVEVTYYIPEENTFTGHYVPGIRLGNTSSSLSGFATQGEWKTDTFYKTAEVSGGFYIYTLNGVVGQKWYISDVSLKEIPPGKIPLAVAETGLILKKDIFGNDATYTGRTRTEAKLVGKNVAVFDGVDDYVLIPDSDELDFGTTDFSVSTRVKYTGDGWIGIVDKGVGAADGGWALNVLSATGKISARIEETGSSEVRVDSIAEHNDGEWHDVVATFDRDGYLKLYIDGVYNSQQDISGVGDISTSYDLTIGKMSAVSSYYFNGSISDVNIYNRVLSATEVADLYSGEVVTSGLIASYPLSEGAGTTVYDTVPTWYGDNLIENWQSTSQYPILGTSTTNSVRGTKALVNGAVEYTGDGTSTGSHYFLFSASSLDENQKSGKVRISGKVMIPLGNTEITNFRISGDDTSGYFYSDYVSPTLGEWTDFLYDLDITGSLGRIFYLSNASNATTEKFYIDDIKYEQIHEPVDGTVTNADLDTFWATDMDVEDQNLVNGYSPVMISDGVDDYIDTGVIPTENTKIEMRARYTDSDFTGRKVFIGSRAGAAGQYMQLGLYNNNWDAYFSITNSGTIGGTIDNDVHMFTLSKNGFSVDNTLIGTPTNPGITSDTPLYLFARNTENSSVSLHSQLEIYYCRIYENGRLIRNYIPQTDGSLLDLIENKKYYNDGTGDLLGVNYPAQSGNTAKDITGVRLTYNPQDLRNSGMAYKNVGVFDGVDDYVDVDDPNDEFSFTDKMTISGWIRPGVDYTSALSQYVAIINRQNTDATVNSWILAINPSGKLHLGSNGGNIQSTQNSWTANTWYHVVATYNATGLTGDLYINGVKETLSVDNYNTMGVVSNSLWIGGSSSLDGFNGAISNVRIYDRVLSDSEVEELYNRKNITNGLVAHYPLSEGAGTTVYDTAPDQYGENLVSPFDLTNNWTGINTTNITQNSFTTSGSGGIYKGVLTLGKKYRFIVKGTKTGGELNFPNTNGGKEYTDDTFDFVHEGVQNANSNLYIHITGANTVTFSSFIVQEIHEPIHGTVTNATVSDFWQIDNALPTSSLYENGFSQGLVNTTAGTVYTPSDVAYGEWEFGFYTTDNTYSVFIIADGTGGITNNTGYRFTFGSGSESIVLTREDAGVGASVLASGDSYVDPNTQYYIKIVRNSIDNEFVTGTVGTFAMYVKGGAFGDDYVLVDVTGGSGTNPATDNTYTTSNYVVVDLDPDDQIANLHIDGHRASVHEFVEGTGEYDKLFIPAQSGRGMDVLGSVLQIAGTKTATFFTAADLTIIAAQKLARAGIHYWDVTTKKFFTGRADGSLVDFVPNTERMKTTAALTTINTNQTADADHNYWDTTLRKFLRGLADGTLVDFLTWYAGE